MYRPLATLAVMLSAVSLTSPASAAPQEFQSGPAQVTLLELYTSEGCSSCPPAEAWLGRFKESAALWKTIVPIAFHVDYWDYLGWHDPWARRTFTDRQRSYASSWNSSSVYTPGFVRNGREWQPTHDINEAPEATTAKPGILHAISTDGNDWKITFTPAEGLTGNFEVHAARLVSELQSDVRAGENNGRHLVHNFTAQDLIDAAMQKQNNTHEAVIKFPPSAPGTPAGLAIAIWITRPRELPPLQAAGGWLTK